MPAASCRAAATPLPTFSRASMAKRQVTAVARERKVRHVADVQLVARRQLAQNQVAAFRRIRLPHLRTPAPPRRTRRTRRTCCTPRTCRTRRAGAAADAAQSTSTRRQRTRSAESAGSRAFRRWQDSRSSRRSRPAGAGARKRCASVRVGNVVNAAHFAIGRKLNRVAAPAGGQAGGAAPGRPALRRLRVADVELQLALAVVCRSTTCASPSPGPSR